MHLGITIGDIAGIGPEILLKALAHPTDTKITVYCDRAIVADQANVLGLSVPDHIDFRPVLGRTPDYQFGQLGADAATVQLASLKAAVADALQGAIDAVVTTPWTKAAFTCIDHPPVGHTEVIAEQCGCPGQEVMMLAGPRLRVSLVTSHVPLRRVADLVHPPLLERVIRTTVADLRRLFGIEHPKVAVCGVNPHAGERGTMGLEDQDVVAPTIQRLNAQLDAQIDGPLPADTLFPRFRNAQPYDAVVAMYHDQGLVALKTLHFGESVNTTLGLPIIRTSVDHGTAYDIAGKGVADASSLGVAIDYALRFAQQVKENA